MKQRYLQTYARVENAGLNKHAQISKKIFEIFQYLHILAQRGLTRRKLLRLDSITHITCIAPIPDSNPPRITQILLLFDSKYSKFQIKRIAQILQIMEVITHITRITCNTRITHNTCITHIKHANNASNYLHYSHYLNIQVLASI